MRDARDRLARLEEQIEAGERDAGERTAGRSRGAADGRAATTAGESASAATQPGDLQRLQQEYNKELQRTRDMVDRASARRPESSAGGSTPEQHEWSRSAPGTEALKQDYAHGTACGRTLTRALERYEAGVADRLSRALTADRLRAGGSDRVPDEYQRRIAKYFEALAKKPGQ